MSRVPALTLLLIGAALLVYVLPPLAEQLVYDRQAIRGGEWWRLLTAPLVHFSAGHLFWNLAVFGAAGWVLEGVEHRGMWLMCAVAAAVPGLLFLLALPELARYGGLSGLATGAVALFCLRHLRNASRNRCLWLAILALMGAKILAEAAMEAPLFAQDGDTPFRVLPAVHVIGFLGALAAVVRPLADKSHSSQSPAPPFGS